MTLRDILVFLDGSEASEGRLQLASRIAQEHQARLSGVFTWEGNSPPARHAASSVVMAGAFGPRAMAVDEAADLARIVEQRFRDHLYSLGCIGSWHVSDAVRATELVDLAKAADLTVIGQTRPDVRSTPKWRPEEIVIGCGRPVLIVPYIGSYGQVGRRVLVAWDGSREAARALNDALPLIVAAEIVILVTVYANARERNEVRASGERILRHLERHGISARIDEMARLDNAASDLILSRSVDLGSDLIVAGAYHHSQWREALFGGVSRDLFQRMTLPVLMSH